MFCWCCSARGVALMVAGGAARAYGGCALYLYVEIHARDFEVGELLLEPSHTIATDSYP